jgi:thiamine-monophosphate kinase
MHSFLAMDMESEFIRWLRTRLTAHPRLLVGPGDDAAVLQMAGGERSVLTVDLLTDGVDFELDHVSPEQVGRKALAVNLSDLAAMAARPLAAVVALALPRDGGLRLAQQLYDGLLPLADKYELAIAGGDTNSWNGPLVVSVTLVGELTPAGALVRSGAQPGDAIVVTGSFGGSILGHHLDFEPRVHEVLALVERYPLHAGTDVSDGLSLDLSRVCEASGCGAAVELDKVPIAPAAATLAGRLADGSTALDHALADGEDFELILAVPSDAAEAMIAKQPLECPLTCIGRFVHERGLWQVDAQGTLRLLEPRGFEHRFA